MPATVKIAVERVFKIRIELYFIAIGNSFNSRNSYEIMYFSFLHERRFIWQLDAIVRLRKGLFNESQKVSKPESSQVGRPKSLFSRM